jgi:hypothetical protein
VYDTLLFLHLLAAFALVATVVAYSAITLGAQVNPGTVTVANVMWDAGGLGTLVFGVWLAINRDEYDILDGWVIAAIVLWALATETGRRARVGGSDAVAAESAAAMHWVRVALVVLLLADMIFKPGA